MKKETAKTIIIILLAGLVVALFLDEKCVVDWIPSSCSVDTIIKLDTVEVNLAHCNDSNRYNDSTDLVGGGIIISTTEARSLIAAFNSQFHPGNQKGVVISKRAIDAIFDNNESANSLVCYFAMNPDRKIHLLFEPIVCNANMISAQAENLLLNDNGVFCTENLCPDWCGQLY